MSSLVGGDFGRPSRDDDLATLTHGFASETLDYAYTYNKVGRRVAETMSDNRFILSPAVNARLLYTVNALNQYTDVEGDAAVYDATGR